MKVSDLERAADWKTDFQNQLAKGAVASLNYRWLPNDHTGGTSKNYLPSDQLVAQNDAALGLIVSTISKSLVWKDSLILVVEDDALAVPMFDIFTAKPDFRAVEPIVPANHLSAEDRRLYENSPPPNNSSRRITLNFR